MPLKLGTFVVYANSKVNNASVVSRIECHGNSILLCGDMEKEAWEFVLNDAVHRLWWHPLVSEVDVLVAPHHGHKSGFSQTLSDLANPAIVLVSVASRDPSVSIQYRGAGVSNWGRQPTNV